MNFLAHSALAFDDSALLAGQYAGDFVRGGDLGGYAPRVALGIRLHRHVDAVGDRHPLARAARARFDPALRRHAGIVCDVVFDHLLARAWPVPAGRDLGAHARWVETALAAHAEALPEPLRRFVRWSERERLLERSVEAAAAAETLERLARRSPRMAPLALAATRVESLAEALAEPFAALWPEIERSARRFAERADGGRVTGRRGGEDDGRE